MYDGAVYLQQGKTYLVKNLDLSTKIASCQEADLKYYTKTRDFTDIEVVNGHIVSLSLNYLIIKLALINTYLHLNRIISFRPTQ